MSLNSEVQGDKEEIKMRHGCTGEKKKNGERERVSLWTNLNLIKRMNTVCEICRNTISLF